MHARSPAVERLYFHLENQQHVYWTDDQQIGEVLSKNTIKESMFTAWMHSNKIYSYGRDLTSLHLHLRGWKVQYLHFVWSLLTV